LESLYAGIPPGVCLALGLALSLALGGCGLAGTAASTAAGATSEAEQARQAKQVEQQVQKDLEATQQKAAQQRETAEKQAE
jgi:hypothetical protein